MTDNNHPITPPPELVEQWRTAPEYASALEKLTMVTMTDRRLQEIASQAARWGADQELEACVEWIAEQDWTWTSAQLRRARRPKPPSLKEQALDVLQHAEEGWQPIPDDWDIIRRALEALPDD